MEPKELTDDWIRTLDMEENRPLHSGRKTYLHYKRRFPLIYPEFFKWNFRGPSD